MNNQRRKDLKAIQERFSDLQSTITELLSDLESLKDEEQEYFDNMPEGLQGSEKGEKAENAISYLDEAIGEGENIHGSIDSIIESIETASE